MLMLSRYSRLNSTHCGARLARHAKFFFLHDILPPKKCTSNESAFIALTLQFGLANILLTILSDVLYCSGRHLLILLFSISHQNINIVDRVRLATCRCCFRPHQYILQPRAAASADIHISHRFRLDL